MVRPGHKADGEEEIILTGENVVKCTRSQQFSDNRVFCFCSSAVAMKAMNKVASHINEMQKIHEEFGAVFDQLITEQSGEKKEVG